MKTLKEFVSEDSSKDLGVAVWQAKFKDSNYLQLTPKAREELNAYSLDTNPKYKEAFKQYCDRYEKRPPSGTADKNMLKALRMSPYHNTPDDWARLHATEIYLKRK